MAKDPICGMYVEEGPGALKAERRGTTYYFCSETCVDTFVAPAKELRRIRRMTTLSFALGIPVLALTWFVFLPESVPQGVLMLILATPVQFVAGSMFYQGAWHAIKARVPNMDVLVALGTTSAWGYSAISVLWPQGPITGTFFDASALIIGFILLGKLLEHQVRGRASDSIRKLLDLRPTRATVIREGVEMEVPVEEVQVGDLMKVKPGEKVPTDGVVVEGNGPVDEKMVTGEANPVDRKEGDEVIGSTVNLTALLTVRATKVGNDTALAQIIRLVEDAEAAQAPIQNIADRVASFFVPLVVGVAAVSLSYWVLSGGGLLRGLTSFVAVLIVACPCALGLATPAAMVVAAGRGAARGILIKGGEQVEKGSKVTSVALDKTGTITAGQPTVATVAQLGNMEELEVLGLAASAESGSEHPMAKAMVAAARERGLRIDRPTSFEASPGMGIVATVGRDRVAVGNRVQMAKEGVDVSQYEHQIEGLEAEGGTVLIVSVGRRIQGAVSVTDQVKETSKEAVHRLKNMGLKVVMITGDNRTTALAVAKAVGIDEVVAQVLPDQKLKTIQAMKDRGEVVAMVGDGINDAPALAQADLGVAVGSGTEVAMETAGIVLMKNDLRDVAGALKLSRATLSKIKQNLFWAFAYNTVLIPVAATGFLSPILAGAAMALSSVSVVSNSLLLNRVALDK